MEAELCPPPLQAEMRCFENDDFNHDTYRLFNFINISKSFYNAQSLLLTLILHFDPLIR
jgi:hypothetical protein